MTAIDDGMVDAGDDGSLGLLDGGDATRLDRGDQLYARVLLHILLFAIRGNLKVSTETLHIDNIMVYTHTYKYSFNNNIFPLHCICCLYAMLCYNVCML